MGRKTDPELTYARKRAYRSLDPFWWSNLAAVCLRDRFPQESWGVYSQP
jgi:hypothetical protein